MLQVFHPNIVKVNLMLYMLQRNPSTTATRALCMRVESGVGWRQGCGRPGRMNARVQTMRHGGSRVRADACEMEQQAPASKRRRSTGRPSASHADV
jgi:hypothetical protein